MNTSRKFIMGCAVLAVVMSSAWAQVDAKIGFINFQEALQGTAQAKVEIEQVQAFVAQKNNEQQGYLTEIDTLQKDLAAKARMLNPDALAQMQADLDKKQTALTRFQEDTKAQIERRRQELLQKYGQRLQEVINEYSQANGYSAIYLMDRLAYGYIDEKMVITTQIIEAFDQKYPLAASSSGGR